MVTRDRGEGFVPSNLELWWRLIGEYTPSSFTATAEGNANNN